MEEGGKIDQNEFDVVEINKLMSTCPRNKGKGITQLKVKDEQTDEELLRASVSKKGYLKSSECFCRNSLPYFPEIRFGARNFPTGELILPTRWLKYGFQGTINAKKSPKKSLFSFRRGL